MRHEQQLKKYWNQHKWGVSEQPGVCRRYSPYGRVENACQLLQDLQSSCARVGLKINFSKTQYITNLLFAIYSLPFSKQIEQVCPYKYLGHMIKFGRTNQTAELNREYD